MSTGSKPVMTIGTPNRSAIGGYSPHPMTVQTCPGPRNPCTRLPGEARIAVKAAVAGKAPLVEPAKERGGGSRPWLGWSVATLLAVGLAVTFLYFRERPPAPDASPESRAMSAINRRLLPFLWIVYIANYLDRTNISMARLRMLPDLNLSEAVYGAGAGGA